MPGNSARSPEGTPLPHASPPRLVLGSSLRIVPILPAAIRSTALAVSLAFLAIALVAAASACAPTVETPAETGLRRDLRDAERIAAQLRLLPLVQAASVTVTRGVDDPLRPPTGPSARPATAASGLPTAISASASVVLALAPGADAQALTADARALVTAVAPEVPTARVTVLARATAPPVELTRLGPFQVASSSRAPLLAALLGLLALCAALGIALALRERARSRS